MDKVREGFWPSLSGHIPHSPGIWCDEPTPARAASQRRVGFNANARPGACKAARPIPGTRPALSPAGRSAHDRHVPLGDRSARKQNNHGRKMKHPSNRELFEYWNERRGTRLAPERADIEPGAIRHVLGDTFVIEVHGDESQAFRLAGTRLCALFGRELKARASPGSGSARARMPFAN